MVHVNKVNKMGGSRQFQVGNYMTDNPVYVPSSVSFQDAIDVMVDKKIGNLIITSNRRPTGLLTEREILQHLSTGENIPDIPVKQVQLHQFTAIEPTASIVEAAKMIIWQKARLLVFDPKSSALEGIITASDIVRAFMPRRNGGLPLGDTITKKPIALDSTDDIFNAVKLMHEKHIGSVLVNGSQGEPLGIFTERDLLTKVLSKQARLEGKLADYCTSPMITAKLKGISAKKAAKVMKQKGIKRLPLTEDGKIAAIVTARDLVESFLLYEEQKQQKSERRKTSVAEA